MQGNFNEKWYGETCIHQVCQFEMDSMGIEDKSEPVLIYCSHSENKMDCEGNCMPKLCPIRMSDKV